MESAGVEFRRLTWIKYLKFKIKVTFGALLSLTDSSNMTSGTSLDSASC